jgi:hypothetical protein
VETLFGKKAVERPRRWKDNIKIYLRETDFKEVIWTAISQDCAQQ